ncbi:MAG: hypothetical protein HXX15_09450 [Rhodopseudomonas sp.]|uniref:hypothetical protein n=1 Tax=Rhodopseudomonas sp. TaxID=1078 RepID=UPI001840D4E4|nr:hypothetical protein [Rhodopseudomonas sp.]NVN86299.1 hypothetical protein [Rhodopseudomonas sp.]
MSQNDPTDQTLAVIASIFEKPEVKPEDHRHPTESGSDAVDPAESALVAPATLATAAAAKPALADIDGYSKYGPGPLDSLRFKWTARFDGNSHYYVDETIGTTSRPISSGPMPRDEVVAFIDEREREAKRRFEALRIQMTSGPSERGQDDG